MQDNVSVAILYKYDHISTVQVESTELSELAETDTLKSSKQPVLNANHDAIKQEMEHSYEFCMQSPQPNAVLIVGLDTFQQMTTRMSTVLQPHQVSHYLLIHEV